MEREREQRGENLVMDWIEGQPAPKAVLVLLACNCPKECSPPRCVLLTASGALTRVDLQTVRTRHQSQTAKKVPMKKLKMWTTKIIMITES